MSAKYLSYDRRSIIGCYYCAMVSQRMFLGRVDTDNNNKSILVSLYYAIHCFKNFMCILILTKVLWERYSYDLPFIVKETEAHRGYIICPRSHSKYYIYLSEWMYLEGLKPLILTAEHVLLSTILNYKNFMKIHLAAVYRRDLIFRIDLIFQ